MYKSYKILIVDDEQNILDALEAAFLTTGFDIYTTTNPITALEMIKETHFNVVIIDIAMPQMNGLDLLKKIKQYNAFIQVIMITGYITIINALNSFRYGASDCFFKPFENPDEIIEAVKTCINKLERMNNFLNKLASSSQMEKTPVL